MTTQAEALAAVRTRLDEAGTVGSLSAWSDPELRGWINEAVRDLARITETIQTKSVINILNADITNNVQEFPMPVDALRVYRVEYQATGEPSIYSLEYGDFNTLDAVWWTGRTQNAGTPLMFTLWGASPMMKITLYPKPSRVGTLTIYYYAMPVDLATDGSAAATQLTVPNGWNDLVYMYVEYLALRRDRDQRWQEAKAAYDERIGDMLTLTRRSSDQAGSFSPQGSMLPSWLTSY